MYRENTKGRTFSFGYLANMVMPAYQLKRMANEKNFFLYNIYFPNGGEENHRAGDHVSGVHQIQLSLNLNDGYLQIGLEFP